MTELVCVLSTGKGTWAEVAKIISSHDWENVVIITDEFGMQNFRKKENMELIQLNVNESIELLIEKLEKELKEKLKGTEVALNLTSGTGKEHMALLSAMLKLGLGIRLVTYTVSGIKEI